MLVFLNIKIVTIIYTVYVAIKLLSICYFFNLLIFKYIVTCLFLDKYLIIFKLHINNNYLIVINNYCLQTDNYL